MADHACQEHAQHRELEWTERHGLDCGPYEHGRDEWWECAVCGEKYTDKELSAMTYERQEDAIDFVGIAELAAERADYVALHGDDDEPEAEP